MFDYNFHAHLINGVCNLKIISMRKVLMFMLILLVGSVQLANAQARRVTGVVTSQDDGMPIPGVTVLLKGTTVGIVTDMDGKYTLDLPADGNVLVFTFVGMQPQEVEINNRTTLNVEMKPDVVNVDEVVVTGVVSGTSRKKLAFTVEKTSGEELNRVPASSAVSALQGKMAGAKVLTPGAPGQSAIIQLRGATSILGSQSPLIIVDGIILDEGREGDTGLSDINAEDIESIEVVKGAAAASLYGSRAANGVIQIITKRGNEGFRLGAGESRTSVTIRNEIGLNYVGDMLPYAKSHPFRVQSNGDYDLSNGARVLDDDQIADNPYLKDYNHQDEIFKDGFTYTNFASVGHATQTANIYLSYQNFRDRGLIEIIDGYQRQNVRLNADFRPTDKLKFALSTMYMNSTNSKTPENVQRSVFNSAYALEPDNNIFDDNEEDGTAYNYDPNPFDSSIRNPYYNLTNRTTTEDRNRYLGNISVTYKPYDWLDLSMHYSLDKYDNKFIDMFVKGYLNSDQGYEGGRKDDWTTIGNSSNFSTSAFMHKKFGDITAKLKFSYLFEKTERERVQVHVRDFATYDVTSFGALSTNHRIRSDKEKITSINYFAIGSIDYKDKIIMDALIRRDGSSLFGSDQRWHNYYRLSGAYRLSQDLKIRGIDEFKLRASYGIAGLRPPFEAQYETYDFADGGAVVKDKIGNRDLKPARAAEFEAGVNIDFLKRFSFSFTYANTKVEDQFLNVPVTAATGFLRQWQNAATINGDVFELSLQGTVFKRGDWSINSGITWDKVTNKVDKLDVASFLVGPNDGSFIIREGADFGTIIGNRFVRDVKDLNANTISQAGGSSAADFSVNSDGFVVLTNTIGTTSEAAIQYYDDENNNIFDIANVNPDFNMSFHSTINWKDLSLYFLWDMTQGSDLYNYTKQRRYFLGTHADIDQMGKPADEKKPSNYYQNFYNQNVLADYFVEDASFIKLRELSVYYTFKKIKGLEWIKELKIGAMGRNLLVFTDYSGYDPEVAIPGNAQENFDVQDAEDVGGGDLTKGTQTYRFDDRGYPYTRSILGSIQIKF
ncbi:SusC/RagA family TonB-linked outer membrane protein [Puteibacter caeruleilacunae]|nr:SusC/RagA family TonB-linked outer membrane protein [Puteibacter caeruleilacunae]